MIPLDIQVETARQLYDRERPMEERCRKLLLGKNQAMELAVIAMSSGIKFVDFTLAADARIEFRGLKVYPVDDSNYCEVAR